MWLRQQNARRRFGRAIDAHYAAVYRQALWFIGDADVAADLVQEVFYQAWKSFDSLRDSERVLPWLLTILRRNVCREQRYRYRHQEVLRQLGVEQGCQQEPDAQELIDLYRALAELSPVHREALLLNVLQGFSYRDISEQLEIPVGTVMSRIARARAQLRERVGRDAKVLQLPTAKSVPRS